MKRLFSILLGFLLVVGGGSQGWAASTKAMALRQAQGLTEFTPPEKFLFGNFVADEMNPNVIFGPVQSFAASRKCPTAWLIEVGDKDRQCRKDPPVKYTLYLEEDCPDQVVYYVFIDQSRLTSRNWIDWLQKFHEASWSKIFHKMTDTAKQWLEWRRQSHNSKTEEQFDPAQANLEQACKEGCEVSGELRFIQKDGELVVKSPEEVLKVDLQYPAIYDLNQQNKISK
jgi:hypothetical protein